MSDVLIYFFVALAGTASFLSPCVLPLVPPYLGFLGGATLDQLTGEDGGDKGVYGRVVLASLVFVLGFTTVFVGLGATASAFGQLIADYRRELGIVAGIFIIIFGLHFLGVIRIPLLYREARMELGGEPASLVGAYLMGLAFAFGWTPCVGPILSAVIGVAATKDNLYTGVSLLFAYSLGLGVPFVLAALAVGPFLGFFKKFRRHLGVVEKTMGLVLILTGLLFAGDGLEWIRDGLTSLTPLLNGKPIFLGLSLRAWAGLALLAVGCYFVLKSVNAGPKAAALVPVFLGMLLIGGSINYLGQWLLDTFPALLQVEEWFVPENLRTDIMNKTIQP